MPELACLMVHNLFANFVEARIFCKIRYVAMHFAVYFDVFYDFATISLQTAIKIMQIVYAANLSRRGIKEFRGNSFGKRIITFLFVARNKVITVLNNHAAQLGYLVGRILKVGVHGYYHIALRFLESAVKSCAFAIMTTELNAVNIGIFFRKFLYHFPGIVCASVVHEYYFIRKRVVFCHTYYPII